MTGPEHYREAERLAGRARRYANRNDADPAVGQLLAAEAQVHATLALAAATALQPSNFGMQRAESKAWRAAAGTPEPDRA